VRFNKKFPYFGDTTEKKGYGVKAGPNTGQKFAHGVGAANSMQREL
jgi:hypothetical protein